MENEIHSFIRDIRKDYLEGALDISTANPNPFAQFELWMKEAIARQIPEPNAMNLSTVNNQQRPSSRIVLLRNISSGGFTFFTNYDSRKGKDLEGNHFAALNFFWPALEKQIRIEGTIEKVSDEDSTAYFQSRPLESRIGAIASMQSSVIPSREFLEKKVEELTVRLKTETPRPANWGGYILLPDYFEFWQGRPNRLHDRIRYVRNTTTWQISRLSP